jgi:hypothetical protein
MKFLFILCISALILISCHQFNKNIIEAEFNVNRSLLSDSSFKSTTGFSIYPPKKWSKTDSYNSELKDKLFHRLDNKLLAIYKSDSTNCTLIISELSEYNYDNLKRLLANPDSFKKQDTLQTNVQSSIFKYKSYEIIQIVSQNSELVIFKLFTHRLSELYELDYVIPRGEINSNMLPVESSIGSLN